MKAIKLISWYLGLTMFVFGILKVAIPTISGWYAVQMSASGLGERIPIWVGITGEIVVGLALLISLLIDKELSGKIFKMITLFASAAIIPMMLTAVYVHLQPAVPASVLPLGIKAPYIPIFTMLLALTNIYLIRRQLKSKAINYTESLR